MTVQLTKQTWPLQRDCVAYYGDPRKPGWLHANTVDVQVPWQMHMDHTLLNHILIHKKCADSLKRVLEATWDDCHNSQAEIAAHHFDRYSGSYNFRPMRGGQAPSMHSYAAAIDWDDEENQQHAKLVADASHPPDSKHHLFTRQTILIVNFLEEGWVWGGSWAGNSIDAMHVQAALVHGG
jgi:D-alanyl-D-alanine carboxypeptidase